MKAQEGEVFMAVNKSGEHIPDAQYLYVRVYLKMMYEIGFRGIKNRKDNSTYRQTKRRSLRKFSDSYINSQESWDV